MATIIRFLIDIILFAVFIAILILGEKYYHYRRFRKAFHTGQYVRFYVGHQHNFGVIVKIHFTKARVRSALDMKEYDKPFYQIHKPYQP